VIQRVCTLLILILAIGGAIAAPAASAQGTPICSLVGSSDGADPAGEPTAVPVESDDSDSAEAASGDASSFFAAPACADSRPYPGPFADMPTVAANPYVAPDIAPDLVTPELDEPITVDVETTVVSSQDSRDLAHSGSESFVLAYLGTGLLAFGAFAMAIRRGTHRE